MVALATDSRPQSSPRMDFPDYPIDDESLSRIKVPPQSLEAEQAVLGGLMIANGNWDGVAELVRASDFYRPEHRLIYEAMERQVEARYPLDLVTLSEALDRSGELAKAGGISYLVELAKNTPSAANVQAYAQIVRERAILRKLIDTANTIADDAYHPEGRDCDALLDDAERKVMQIGNERIRGGGPKAVNPLLKHAVERIDELFNTEGSLTGLTTGYTDLDGMTNGLQPADLIIVAGRPSMGKTTFAMNLVENALMGAGKPTVVFSLEMPAEALITRMISSVGHIDQGKLRTGKLDEDDWPRLSSAIAKLKDKPLFIDDTPAITPTEMRSRLRRLAREHGEIGLIMVDYLQLMQVAGGKSEGRTAEISEISRGLKGIAKEFNAPMIALSQLNRSLEQRPNKRPVMSDLRESGAIEQDADIIAFIYRDEVYNPESQDKGVAEIIIGKHRNGPIGTVRLAFIGKHTRFENLAYTTGYTDFEE